MSHVSNIIAALPESDYPPLLLEALAFQTAADAQVAAANDEQPVSLSTAVTPKDVAKVVAAAVTFDLGHDLRIRHANTLARIATERTGMAQQRTATLAESSFAEKFNDAAKVLTDLIAKRGKVDPAVVDHGGWPFDPQYAELREALADVARLSDLRDDFAFLGGGGQLTNVPVSNVYEKHSRTKVLADVDTSQALEQVAAKYGWNSAGYWIAAAQLVGVTIRWQTGTQQHEQPAPAAIARERALMQANHDAVSKARGTARRIA